MKKIFTRVLHICSNVNSALAKSNLLKGKSIALISALVFGMAMMPGKGLAQKCPSSNAVTPSTTQTKCVGQGATTLSDAVSTTGTGSTPAFSYQWYYNTTNSNTIAGATVVAGATNQTYTPLTTVAEVGTRYYFCVGYNTATCGSTASTQSLASNAVQVTVNVLPTITSTGTAATVCFSASAQTTTMPYTGTTNSPTSYSIDWNAAANTAGLADQGSTAFAFAGGGGTVTGIVITANTPAGSYSGTMTVTNANGCTATQAVSVTVNALPTITSTGTAAAVCFSASAQTTTMPYTATTNSPTSYSIDWNAAANTAGLADQGSTAFAFAGGGGTVTGIVITANTPAGSYSGTMTVTNANGCTATQAVSVTVNALPTITSTGTAAAVCFSAGAQTTTMPYTATTNSPTSYSIDWNAAANTAGLADQGSTAFAFAGGGGTVTGIVITANTPAGSYSGTMTVTNANGCTGTKAISVIVNALPTITSTGIAAAKCFSASAQTTTMPYTATTNSPTSYSIDWDAAANTAGLADQGSTAFAFAGGGGTVTGIVITAGTPAGSYSGTMTVTNANGCTATQAVSVTVNALPTITSTGTAAAVCFSANAQTTTMPYTATTNSPTSYSIDWDAAANTAGLADQGSTAFAFAGGGGTVTGIVITAGTPAGSYSGTMTITNGNGCTNTLAVSVTVNALPTITTAAIAPACFDLNAQTASLTYGATTNSPTTYSIVWSFGALGAGFVNVTDAALPVSPISISVPAAAATGSYTGTITVKNANGCESTGTPFTVQVYEPVIITSQPDPSQTVCATYPVSFSVTATGDGLTYQWYKTGFGALSDNVFISGSNTATLTIDPTDLPDAGTYYVVVSGTAPCASVTSNNAVLVVDQKIVINTQPATPQTVCEGGSVTLTVVATGGSLSYQWRNNLTDLADGTLGDGAIISGATTASLTISNITPAEASTKYSVVIVDAAAGGQCDTAFSNKATVIVNKKSLDPTSATAASTTICNGQSTTLTLVGGGGGTGEVITWYEGACGGTPIGTGNAFSVSPTVTTTYYGRYEDPAPCSYNSACASVTITVNQKSADPTSATAGSATICNGQSTTLTLNGGGGGTGEVIKWYTGSCGGTLVGTGNGASVSPTVTTTYYGRYEDPAPCSYNSACVSVTVTVNQKSANPTSATASSTSICTGSSVTLTLNGGGGGTGEVITWYSGSCGGTLEGTGNGLSVSPAVTTTYYGRYEDPAPCSYSSTCASVTINVSQPATTSNAGADQSICGTSTSLAGNTPTAGTGAWSIVSATGVTGGTSLGTPSSPTSTLSIGGFNGATGQAVVTLVWTISNSPCPASTDTVIVTFKKTPTANAGVDKSSSCASSVTLGATAPLTGWTGTWSIISGSGGTVTNPNSATSTFTSTAVDKTTYTLVWTVTSSPCPAATDTMIVTIIPPITGDTIYVASFCRDQTTGVVQLILGQWGTLHGGNGTFTYSWERSCDGTSSWAVLPGETNPYLVITQGSINCFYRRTVTGSPCTAELSGSTGGAANGGNRLHININNNLSSTPFSITPFPTASYCNGGLGVQVGTSGSLLGDPTNAFTPYTVWYYLYRDGVLVDSLQGTGNTLNFGYKKIAGTYTVKEVITLNVVGATNCPGTSLSNSLVLTIDANVQPDPVSAGPNQTVCDSAITAAQAAIVGTGAWTIVSGSGTIKDTLSNITTITNLNTGANTFKWKLRNGACADSNTVVITAYQSNKVPTSVGAAPNAFCNGGGGTDLTQTGGSLGTGASWKWYSDPTYTTFVGTGVGANALLHVNPTTTTTYYLRAEGATAPCATNTAGGNIMVTVNQRPTATMGPSSQYLCNGSASITITFTGTAPWTFTYSTDNCVTKTTVTTSANPYTLTVSPAVNSTYKICSLSDLNCTSVPADYNGTSAAVTVLSGPAGQWTGLINHDWFTCSNWANGFVPTIATAVTVPSVTNSPEINAAGAVCASLNLSDSLTFLNGTAYLTDAGNVTIQAGGKIVMTLGGTAEIRGNWDNQVGAAGFIYGTGKITFAGATSPATITTTAGTETFYDLQLNKTNTTDRVHLKKSLIASHDLTLTQGIFVTENNLFTWNNSGGTLTAPEPTYTPNSLNYTKSFIATCDASGAPISVANATTPFGGGAGFQIKNVGSSNTYFPVGASYLPAGTAITTPAPNRMMINNQLGSIDFTVVVNYGDIGYTNGGGGTWRVNRIWYLSSGAATSGKATMQLFFTKRDWTLWPNGENEVEAGFDYTKPALLQKDYSGGAVGAFINLSEGGDLVSFAGNLINTEIYGVYTINISTSLTNGIQQFNRFSVVNPGDIILPVTITNIRAWQDGASIKVGWTSQQETNIDHYEVEKALDAQHFAFLGNVPAKNNGLTSEYLFPDNHPATGNNFYRIKVVDKNGTISYTSIVVVNTAQGFAKIFVFPNPVSKHMFNLQMNNVDAGKYKLQVYDAAGRVIVSRDVEHFGGSSTQQIILSAGVASGAYRVVLFSNDKIIFKTTIIVAD